MDSPETAVLSAEAVQTSQGTGPISAGPRPWQRCGMVSGRIGHGVVAQSQFAPGPHGHDHRLVRGGRTGQLATTVSCITKLTETAGCDEHVRWCERGEPQGTPLLD